MDGKQPDSDPDKRKNPHDSHDSETRKHGESALQYTDNKQRRHDPEKPKTPYKRHGEAQKRL
jgi:hypothetical protein